MYRKHGLKTLATGIENWLNNIITRVTEKGYAEQSKINFSLLYFNIAQIYLSMGKYDVSMENLEMASQYQKVRLFLVKLNRIF